MTLIKDENQNIANVDTLTVAQDFGSGNQPIYIGRATPGTPKSSSGWQIMKITYDGNKQTDIQWASGNAKFDKKWTERKNYTYS